MSGKWIGVPFIYGVSMILAVLGSSAYAQLQEEYAPAARSAPPAFRNDGVMGGLNLKQFDALPKARFAPTAIKRRQVPVRVIGNVKTHKITEGAPAGSAITPVSARPPAPTKIDHRGTLLIVTPKKEFKRDQLLHTHKVTTPKREPPKDGRGKLLW